jgi:hemerythrin-like domain-containing protein
VPFQSDATTATNIEGLLSEHECAKMTIAKLEDQVRELERKLEEFKSDSESQLQVTK